MMSETQTTNQNMLMYSIFTALYCHGKTPDGWDQGRFMGLNITPHDKPEFVDQCKADLEAGRLEIEVMRRAESVREQIPCQFSREVVYFGMPVPFGEELRCLFESGKPVYAYSDYDYEMPEYQIRDIFTANRSFPSDSLHGWSDGLKIERVDSFAGMVARTFKKIYCEMSGYHPCIRRRVNRLKGVTEAIFQGKIEGPQAEVFRTIFPSPACRRPIIDYLWSDLRLAMETLPERFIEEGLD